MRPVFYDDPPVPAGRSVFLAGPTARGVVRTPWRARALALLDGFDGAVVLPEFRDRPFAEAAPQRFGGQPSPVPHMRDVSHAILAWETAAIEGATRVLFWMPFALAAEDDVASLPGFTTRAEVSRELARAPERLILGMPPGALSGGHIRYHAHQRGVRIHDTLEATVAAALPE